MLHTRTDLALTCREWLLRNEAELTPEAYQPNDERCARLVSCRHCMFWLMRQRNLRRLLAGAV